MNLTEIRQKYPQYDNLSDEQLVIGLHKKYYPQMDFNDFAQRVGYRATPEQMPEFSPEALAQIEANNQAYDDKSHMGWNVAGDALSGAGEGVLSGIGRLASGVSFGASDWLDRKTGGTLAALDDRLQRRADNAGVGTLNKVAKVGTEIVGNIAPGGAITRGLAQKGVKSALAQSALGGGIGGALYGATASDKLSDLPVNTIVGGFGGTIGGAALHSAISGIGTVGGLFRNNLKKGMDYIRKTKGDEYLQNMIDEATQKGVSLAEVADERGLKMVQMARQQTSDADDIITQNMQAIKDNVPNKNTETLNDMFGTKSGYRMAQEAEQEAMDKARPMFVDLESKGDLGASNTLSEVVKNNDVIGDTIKNVKRSYSMYKGLPDTDAKVILQTHKLLSQQTKSPDATLAYQAKQALKEFDDALPADFREGLKKANKIYKDNYQFAEAQKSAKDIFNKEISPEEFNDKFGKMTAEEKQALRGGLRDELFSIVENRTNETLGWNRVVPRPVKSKIRRVLGDEEGNKLIDYAQTQLKSMRNSNKVLSGSQTSEKQNLRDIASTGQRILDNPTGILGAVSRMIPWNNARNMGIARIMTNPSADLARATYEQAISPQGWEAVYQALYNPRGFTKYNTALAAYLAGRELQQ